MLNSINFSKLFLVSILLCFANSNSMGLSIDLDGNKGYLARALDSFGQSRFVQYLNARAAARNNSSDNPHNFPRAVSF